MRIKKLEVEGYKNLNIKITHDSDVIALIGKNGSGKSNLLEAISAIFKSLYYGDGSVPFDYLIEYENTSKQNVRIEKKKSKKKCFLNEEFIIDVKDYLPKKLIAIYSGEEDRLWSKYYKSVYDDFIRDINKKETQGLSSNQGMPKMVYINKLYWHISLLSLALSDSHDNKKFIEEVLNIKHFDKVKFDFYDKNYEGYSNSPTLEFVRAVDEKSEYTLNELKKILDDKGYIADDVFKYLYSAYTPEKSKIIKDIIIKFNDYLTIEDLSEGEKKLLLVKAAFEFAEQEDSLFILDEPDAHVHLGNKEQIVKAFEPYKNNRQIVVTTHSPTVTQSLSDESLYMLNEGQNVKKEKQIVIDDLAGDFWNKQQQNIFITSKKQIVLFVEGRHDKIHILNAFRYYKSDYPFLDLDIFSLEGETNIAPMLKGMRDSKISDGKLYIGIYDNDSAGQTSIKKNGFDKENDGCGYRKLKDNKYSHHCFYSFCLPKPEAHTKDCTIENMVPVEKYEDAYKLAFESMVGHFLDKSIDDISKGIKEKSKNILAEKSKDFEKEDFKYFRKLFDVIEKIYNEYKASRENSDIKEKTKEKSDAKEKIGVKEKIVSQKTSNSLSKEETDFFKSKKVKENIVDLYLKIREKIVGKNDKIKANVRKHYIVIKGKTNFTFIKFTQKKISLIAMQNESEIKKKIKFHDVKHLVDSVQKFYNGECAQIEILNGENLKEVIDLLIEIKEKNLKQNRRVK